MVTRGKVANVNSLYVKSILAFENGRYSDAAQLSGKCVSINPENGQYQRHLGKICAEAKICFEQCVLLEPRFLEARHALTEMK